MLRTVSAVVAVIVAVSCGGRVASLRGSTGSPPPTAELAQLWTDPGTVPRDLYLGVGGSMYAPSPSGVFEMEERDDSGYSVSYDVRSEDGTRWSAKIGPEAQTEVVMSRLLWGVGYHQPPIYYLPSWTLAAEGRRLRESEARFRPKLMEYEVADDVWQWADNPFLAAREFRGLLVVLLMLNSTDLKDDNNSIYDVKDAQAGARRWFVVRDLGAALGETGKLYPRRNWLEGFEQAGFITGVSGDRVEFAYRGRHRELLSMISVSDVQWAAARMNRLTDAQWQDAFRAGNYDPAVAARYIRRIRQKIADGLALRATSGATEVAS